MSEKMTTTKTQYWYRLAGIIGVNDNTVISPASSSVTFPNTQPRHIITVRLEKLLQQQMCLHEQNTQAATSFNHRLIWQTYSHCVTRADLSRRNRCF